MDSWFGKLRQKLAVEQKSTASVEEDEAAAEEKERVEKRFRDTLRKMNTDGVLNDDDIARMSEFDVRKDINKSADLKTKPSQISVVVDGKSSVTILNVPGNPNTSMNQAPLPLPPMPPQEQKASEPTSIIDEEERFGSEFWD